jgi:hypothetical protein
LAILIVQQVPSFVGVGVGVGGTKVGVGVGVSPALHNPSWDDVLNIAKLGLSFL